MKLITLYPPPANATPNLRTVKPWGDPVMTADSYSVAKRLINGQVVGQFSLVQVYQTDALGFIGDMGANTTARNVTSSELMYIASLQAADEFTVDQKMVWLLGGGNGKWGSPMRGEWGAGETWKDARNVQMIAAVWAGQPVEVLEERTFYNVVWQGKVEPSVEMCRIKTGRVVEVTAVNGGDRLILPKGHIFLPLWFRATPWVFRRWLA